MYDFISLAGVSIPQFWLGLMLMKIFSMQLGWFPLSGMGSSFFSLDGLCTYIPSSIYARSTTNGIDCSIDTPEMLEVLRQDYIRTAKKRKALRYSAIVIKHALKNAALPLVTVIGTQTGYMMSGSVVIENIFCMAWLRQIFHYGDSGK